MTYPIFEYVKTGEKFTCIFHALRMGWEWYGFKKYDYDNNIYEGFVMNIIDTIDEFRLFDVREVLSVCDKRSVSFTPEDISKVLPPIGFRRIM